VGRERARRLIPRLEAVAGVTVLQDGAGDDGTWPYFLLRLPGAVQRDRALATLWRAGLGVSRAFCQALPDYPELRGILGEADVPQARDFAARTLTVTNSPWLQEAELERICAALEAAIG
jgi:dTDP-4-amino-4,6-dideoxygalactose transaminase